MTIFRKIIRYLGRSVVWLFILIFIYIFVNSALDLYNNFAYDKAILRPTPYGYTPILSNPKYFTRVEREVMSGEYVYVEDWLSAYEHNIAFAKVRSKLSEGYINNALLVEANFNPKPLASVLFLCYIVFHYIRKIITNRRDKIAKDLFLKKKNNTGYNIS